MMRNDSYGGGLFEPLSIRDFQKLMEKFNPKRETWQWPYARHCVRTRQDTKQKDS